MSDQDRIFLQYQYNIKQTGDESREKYQLGDYKLIQYQFLLYDLHHKNCMADSKENYLWDLGS